MRKSKRLLAKNTQLKRILSSNYNELLNCSGLVRSLFEFSAKIRDISQENLAKFEEFREKRSETAENRAELQESRDFLANFERFLRKIREKQRNREFFCSQAALSAVFLRRDQLFRENPEEDAFSWVFNMIIDEKALNKQKTLEFLQEVIEKSEVSAEKPRIFTSFQALLLVFLEESCGNQEKAAENLVKHAFSIVSRMPAAVFCETLEFLAILKRFLEKDTILESFEKIERVQSQKIDDLLDFWQENCEKTAHLAPKNNAVLPSFYEFLTVFCEESAKKLEIALFSQEKGFN